MHLWKLSLATVTFQSNTYMHGSSCIQVLNFTSDACCSASRASLCQRKSVSNRCLFCVISLTRRWKGNFAISNPVVLWYFLIYKIEHPVHGWLWPGHVAMMDAIFHLPECSSSYTPITPMWMGHQVRNACYVRWNSKKKHSSTSTWPKSTSSSCSVITCLMQVCNRWCPCRCLEFSSFCEQKGTPASYIHECWLMPHQHGVVHWIFLQYKHMSDLTLFCSCVCHGLFGACHCISLESIL